MQDPNGQPLRKVDIRVSGRGNEKGQAYSTTTDAEGKFEIEGVEPGRYSIVLERPGFFQVGGRPGSGVSVMFNSATDAKDLLWHMEAAAVITGKIIDNDGDPVPEVSVQASRIGSVGRFASIGGFANTNDLGEYRIANLRPGKYLLSANPVGGSRTAKLPNDDKNPSKAQVMYVQTYYPGSLEKAQAVAVEVHPGDEAPVNFGLLTSPTYFIRGTVAKPSDAKFAAMILQSRGGEVQRNATPGADGSFEFRDLLPGSYSAYLVVLDQSVLSEQKESTNPAQVQFMRLGQPLEITNANLEGVRLAPASPGHVRGRFRMDKGTKIEWAQLSVLLMPDDFSAGFEGSLPGGMATARVQSDGTFDVPTVTAGLYRLSITSNGDNLQDYFTKAVNLEGKDVSDSGFTVSGGTSVLDVVVSKDGATVEGTVVDAKGKPVADASVVAVPNGERRKRFDVFGSDTSDAQGHFRLRGLMPGPYTVLAWDEVVENVRDPEFLSAFQDRGEMVELEESSRKTVSVKVIPSDNTP